LPEQSGTRAVQAREYLFEDLCQQTAVVERFSNVGPNSVQESNALDFDKYCEEMLPRLVAFGLRITRDQGDAEDVAIETLARTMLRWGRVSSEAWRDAWVFRVAANLSIDVLRKRQRVTLRQEMDMPSAEGMPEPPISLEDILSHLPRRQREVVFLRYYGDLTYEDIGRRLRISDGAVKTHLHRGITVASPPAGRSLVKEHAMVQSGYSMMTRPTGEMVTDIHHRAAALRRRKLRRRALASVGCLAVVSAGALALVASAPSAPHKTVTSSPRDAQLARYQQLLQETAQESAGPTPQPPQEPVGSGWSASKPSLPTSVPPEWSPLVISALEVFEHETRNDQPRH
jgi:RNA polymerase sigma factor (sigma-70 family)